MERYLIIVVILFCIAILVLTLWVNGLQKDVKRYEIEKKHDVYTQLMNDFASFIKRKMLESELHDEIANRLEDRCNGDKSKISMYMNFIYRLKTLQDDIELFNAYVNIPERIGIFTGEDTLKIRSEISEVFLYDESPLQIVNRLKKYNDYLYFDELNEKSFESGYWVDFYGDYVWKQDDKSFEEKYAELVKCILNQLNEINTYWIEDRFPKLVKLIERNKKVCQDKLNELENKQE